MEHSRLFLGTVYHMEGLSAGEIQEDLQAMKAANLNFVRIGDRSWPLWEPREGVYDLSRLWEFLTLCKGLELGVLLAVSGQVLPDWLQGAEEETVVSRLEALLRRLAQVARPFGPMVGFQLERGDDHASRYCRLLRAFLGEETPVVAFGASPRGKDLEGFSALGCAIYHRAGLRNTGAELTFRGDYARGSLPYLVLETQCQGRLGQLPYPGQLRLWAFHHIASGARGLAYMGWNSETAPGSDWKGVVGYGGSQGRCYREVSAIGQEFARLSPQLAGLRKRNRAAVLYSYDSFRNMRSCGGKSYHEIMRWICDGLYKLNIEVDLLPDTTRDFSDYSLLITPCLYSAEDALIMALRNFVAEGGYLLSTFRSFFADAQGNIRKGPQPYGMTDVFGMHYEDATIPEETCLPEYVAEVSHFMEILELEDAMSLAIYDSPAWRGIPAATCCRFGKGQAAYIGCYSEEGFEPILLRLLAMWHYPVPETAWPVVQKRAIGPSGKTITFLLHYSPASRVIPSPATGRELFSGRHLDEGEPLELRGWDVKILEEDL